MYFLYKKKIRICFINFPKKSIVFFRKIVFFSLKEKKINTCELNFILLKNREMKNINEKYRKKNTITDVISFLLVPKMLIGDIYIAKEQSKIQAIKYNNTWEAELIYLIIHGLLHLYGYTDYDKINKTKMFNEQNKLFKQAMIYNTKLKNFKY
ncbi:MAG: rRNA maturation RNase YbeY [Endomicrobium sp.]|jgi:probable rRNA maturation factor|nr:rRNA maturation RNase YbeY [Endomicrobium sp.]